MKLRTDDIKFAEMPSAIALLAHAVLLVMVSEVNLP